MLGKLLKYEIPALGRKLMPLYIGWMATAVLLGFSITQVESKSELFIVISELMYVAVATAVAVMAIVLIIQRYNNDLLGDGGYFSHSLPVSAAQHISSKAIAAFIWLLVSFAALILTALIVGSIGYSGEFFSGIGQIFRVLGQLSAANWLVLLEILLVAFASEMKSILAIYTAITIGHQAKERVILASIGAYIGLLVAETTITNLVTRIIPGFNSFLINGFEYADSLATMSALLISTLLFVLAISLAYFFLCKYFMEKKLNLA